MSIKIKKAQDDVIINYLVDPDFDLHQIKQYIVNHLNDEEFFELMLNKLQTAEEVTQKNALIVLTFLILEVKDNVSDIKNEEPLFLAEQLINEHNVNLTINALIEQLKRG